VDQPPDRPLLCRRARDTDTLEDHGGSNDTHDGWSYTGWEDALSSEYLVDSADAPFRPAECL